jgi:ubiquinol-cytochrome c reductase cytochrome b subunit
MKKKCYDSLEKRLPIQSFLKTHLFHYMVPSALNVWYVFGLLALIMLFNQYVSGIWLAMFYIPSIQQAFPSIQAIMHDIPSGWFIRLLHTTGASMLFVVLYLHMFRGFLYGSYQKPRELVWILGVILLLMMYVQAFFGYVLPWGQMSYWGAEVATSAISAIPFVGEGLMYWIRGGIEVGAPILQRFYALHVIAIPLLLMYMIKLHVIAIRYVGSSTPVHEKHPTQKIPFFPHHVIKESMALMVMITVFFAIIFFIPDMGGIFIEKYNDVPANPMQTPPAIHPAWYLTPYFAMLRSVPSLLGGVLLTLLNILLWGMLPFLDKSRHRLLVEKNQVFRWMVYLFWVNFVVLGVLGWYELTLWGLWCSRVCTLYYTLFFILMPFYSRWSEH